MSGKPGHSRFIDITGQVFGRWTVMSRALNNRRGNPQWHCRCECGTEAVVLSGNLREGKTLSCGCLARSITSTCRTTHGATRGGATAEYRAWRHVHSRCTNPRVRSWANYGARGITICERWRGDGGFVRFLEDMGSRPSPDHSIERIDNEGPYSPDNCRWATRIEQGNNKRNNRRFTYEGRSLTIPEWSRETGINFKTLGTRLNLGWSFQRAITEPVIVAPRPEADRG
jgi:hypothetical protein